MTRKTLLRVLGSTGGAMFQGDVVVVIPSRR